MEFQDLTNTLVQACSSVACSYFGCEEDSRPITHCGVLFFDGHHGPFHCGLHTYTFFGLSHTDGHADFGGWIGVTWINDRDSVMFQLLASQHRDIHRH